MVIEQDGLSCPHFWDKLMSSPEKFENVNKNTKKKEKKEKIKFKYFKFMYNYQNIII